MAKAVGMMLPVVALPPVVVAEVAVCRFPERQRTVTLFVLEVSPIVAVDMYLVAPEEVDTPAATEVAANIAAAAAAAV